MKTEQFGSNFIKLAVDIKREILAGGGELHSDCEQALLEVRSRIEKIVRELLEIT